MVCLKIDAHPEAEVFGYLDQLPAWNELSMYLNRAAALQFISTET